MSFYAINFTQFLPRMKISPFVTPEIGSVSLQRHSIYELRS